MSACSSGSTFWSCVSFLSKLVAWRVTWACSWKADDVEVSKSSHISYLQANVNSIALCNSPLMKAFDGQPRDLEVSSGGHPRVQLAFAFGVHGGYSRTSQHSTRVANSVRFHTRNSNHSFYVRPMLGGST